MELSKITRQSLTDEEFLTLLGISQWVFNSNCCFIIEMVDSEHHSSSAASWFEFLGLTAGQIANHKDLVIGILGREIYDLLSDLVVRRNMIMHSVPTGETHDGYYVPMYRKNKNSSYFVIDKSFLKKFISDNETLSSLIYKKREA